MPTTGLYLLFLLTICCSQSPLAQEYPFIQYTPKDGLVNSRLRNIYQDSKGRMFFMTANGLSVYDGARFTNYTEENGLANPVVNDILELGTDSMLLATNAGKLNVWVRGKIKNVVTKNGYCPVINKFFRSGDNVIYVATDQGFFSFKNNQFFRIPIDSSNIQTSNSFDDIQEVGDYFLLKQNDQGWKFNKVYWVNKQTHEAKIFNPKTSVNSIIQIPEYNLLLLLTLKGIISFDLKAAGSGLIKDKELPAIYRTLNNPSLFKMLIDRKKNLWGITSSSIFSLTGDKNLLVFNKTNGLDVSNIHSIFIDRENVLWILTDGSGVIKLPNSNVEIVTGLFGESATSISAIYPEPLNDKVWTFNFQNNTLYCKTNQELQSWKLDTPVHIWNIQAYRDVLYLFDEHTIYTARPKTNKRNLSIVPVFHQTDVQMNFGKAWIDSSNNIFIPGGSILVINPGKYSFSTPLPYYTDQIAADDKFQLWAASRSGDLLCYKVAYADKKTVLVFRYNLRNVVPTISPRSVAVDKNGKVWVGTRFDGVYCFEFRDTSLVSQQHFTTKDGLTDNFVYHLACDDNNVMWTGTQSGLDKISIKNGRYAVEGITRNNNIFQLIQTIAIGKKNQVWTLGNGSVIRVNNDQDIVREYKPQLQIIRIRTADSSFENPVNDLTVSYRYNDLTFEVAAPSFIDEKQVQFSYLLEGSDKNKWSTQSSQATFNFINLPHGRYVLHVKAFFPVPEYPPQELTYKFTITPPWWQTWWFRLVAAVGGAAFIAFLVRSYYQRKLEKQKIIFEKQQAIEQERTRIAMEMHDDLGSGLTTIRYLAGGLSLEGPPVTKDKATKIETSAKTLVDNMNDIIWTMKSDNNTLSELLGYIRKQTAEQLENAGIDYHFNFPKNIPGVKLTNEQKRNLLLISKEAVHNIVKHAQATSVTLTATCNGAGLQLSIADNGKGIDLEKTGQFGNGLKNMRRRAEQINAHLYIENKNGTTVIVDATI